MPHIIAYHPKDNLEGTLIPEGPALRRYVDEGAIAMPVDVNNLFELASGGFLRRHWGVVGWPITKNAGEKVAPCLLQIREGIQTIHWALAVERSNGSGSVSRVRLFADTSQSAALSVGLTNNNDEDVRDIGDDVRVFTGSVALSSVSAGFLALAFWVVGQSCSARWSAVSQS